MQLFTVAVSLLIVGLCRAEFYEESFERVHPEIKAKAQGWESKQYSRFAGMSARQMTSLLGTKLDKLPGPTKWHDPKKEAPATFDARQQWPQCKHSIGFIRDQATCGSCWAVSSAEVMTDRHCIKNNGTGPYISDEDILACCGTCGFGCNGGYPLMAFEYWNNKGVVTGGPYGSNEGCLPYEIKPCTSGCGSSSTPRCENACEKSYNKTFDQDKHHGASYFNIEGGVAGIQQEIIENGPVVGCFSVYEDFYHYSTGVYYHVSGGMLGGHAVKILGWGTENNIPYWLIANSWNTTWGMDGYFKIRRGTDECGIESQALAGLPLS